MSLKLKYFYLIFDVLVGTPLDIGVRVEMKRTAGKGKCANFKCVWFTFNPANITITATTAVKFILKFINELGVFIRKVEPIILSHFGVKNHTDCIIVINSVSLQNTKNLKCNYCKNNKKLYHFRVRSVAVLE